jgi:MFS family permease
MRTPVLREYLICALLFNLASAFAEVILPLWLKDKALIDGPRGLMVIFLTAGLVLTFVQAKLIGVMVKRIGESRMFQMGMIGFATALVLLTVAGHLNSFNAVVVIWCLSGASMAFFFTGNSSLISKCAAADERGTVLGAASAVGTVGRIIGPSLTGFLYVTISPDAPFYFGAFLLMIGLLIFWFVQSRSVDSGVES